MESPSFLDLKERLRRGDPSAPAEVFQRFRERLIRLAAGKLSRALRRKMDPEDLVQSAFKSFFRVQADQVPSMLDWDNLWSLLTTITLRKCGYQVRHFLTAKRHIDKEVAPPPDAGSSWEGIAREPTPAEAAAFSEIVEHWLGGLDETERHIAELHLQGYSPGEISKQVDLIERTIARKLKRIRDRLKTALEEGDS